METEADKSANPLWQWKEGYKCEVLDPLEENQVQLAPATVKKVYPGGYLKLTVDEVDDEDTIVVLHKNSFRLFPAGYGETHALTVAFTGHKGQFKWEEYLKSSGSTAAPKELFEMSADGWAESASFKKGDKLEAVDINEPNLICAATIQEKHGRLLRVHFDGWDDDYDQLFDYRSPCLFPLGYCEMVGYKLEAPPGTDNEAVVEEPVSKKPKKADNS